MLVVVLTLLLVGWIRKSYDTYDDEALLDAGTEAAHLWGVTLGVIDGKGTDGVLSRHDIAAAAAKWNVKRAAAERALLEVGKWHDLDGLKRCAACRERSREDGTALPTEHHRYVHAWWVHVLDAQGRHDKQHRRITAARTALTSGKDTELRAEIRRRDKDECQYCGIVTRWPKDTGEKTGDRKSLDLGTIDHVDPFAEVLNTPGNLVVACKGCNGGGKGEEGKKGRTPAQWHAAGGRLLRRPIDENTDPSWVDQAKITDRSQIEPATIPDPRPVIMDPPRVARDSGQVTDPARSDHGSPAEDQARIPDTAAVVSNGNGTHTEENR